MSSKFVSQIRKHAPGTLQHRIDALSADLPEASGKPLLGAAREVGDHLAGLVAAFSTIGLVDIDKALPKLGHASVRVRSGTTLSYSPDTMEIEKVPLMLDPKRIKSVDK